MSLLLAYVINRLSYDAAHLFCSDSVLQEELQGWDIQFSPHLVGVIGRQVQKERIFLANNVEVNQIP